MVRNDTTQSSKGSTSAITHYNGTNWRYFENELNTSFNTVIWSGDGASTRSIAGVGFKPDLIWAKARQAQNHTLYDSVRGIGRYLASDGTTAETTSTTYGQLTSFDSDGFTGSEGTNQTYSFFNSSSQTYVGWCFKAPAANNSADFNGSGSIQSSISKTALANNFSVSFWWKPDLMNTFQVPMGGLYDETGGIAYGWMVYQGSDNKMYLYWIISSSPNTSNSISNNVVLEQGKWYHVVATKTSSGASIYVNGSSASSSPSQGSQFNIVYNTNPSFYIGKRNVSNNYANGIINQVRVFTSALSASQVTELYNETAADNNVLNYPAGASCIAAYPLGENANDLSGNYNGTASNVTFGLPGYLSKNTEGSTESTVIANNDLGFSIVKTSGTSGQITFGHGLDTAPEMIINKGLTTNGWSWLVYHKDVGTGKYLMLNSAGTFTTNAGSFSSITSTTITNNSSNNSSDYINYCFASKPNYSKVGSYVGNGSATGPIVTLGFEPAFVMIKGVDQTSDWTMLDNKRDPSNPNSARLDANSNMAEYSAVGLMDFNSDGFQIVTTQGAQNGLNKTFIYLAFANTI
ncbi:MAG: hypothetical protein CMI60_00605 [Parvibaculum sp.]|nr:hypothetical protein [Parvibaculum sp.]